MNLPDQNLTDKQLRFCQEYVKDLNGTQAAIRAGYSSKTAKEIAAENLTKPNIALKITELQKAISEQLNIDHKWVLNRLLEISDRCMTVKPVMTFDYSLKEMVQEKAEDENGNIVGVYEFDASGATKATELIGKHLGFFKEDNSQRSITIAAPNINVYGTPPQD